MHLWKLSCGSSPPPSHPAQYFHQEGPVVKDSPNQCKSIKYYIWSNKKLVVFCKRIRTTSYGRNMWLQSM